ncbi:MAG: DUF4129 domain-containing protein [Anaerolineales bacterium]|nr:DUF4129 domain-containing protein [Chloroflexota bacterium]MBL6983274.1 DUF4129 domain-containing protein [Anaerolineales bacterium]
MVSKSRFWIIIFFGLGVGILVILTSSLTGIEFMPGQPFFLSAEEQNAPLEDLNFKTWNLVGLWNTFGLILLWVIFPLSIIYFIVSPDVRKAVIRRALTLGLTAYAFFLLLRQCDGFNPADMLNSSIAEGAIDAENAISANFSPEVVPWFEWIGYILFFGAIVYAVWFGVRWWSKRISPLEEITAEANKILDDLHGGADLKDTVLRCYAEMSRVLQQRKGIRRSQAMTPREFEIELVGYSLPRDDVQQLTRLFEIARYGDATLGEQEYAQALACLEAIIEASDGKR